MDFACEGAPGEAGKGGEVTLYVNDAAAGRGRVDKTVPARFGIDAFGVGEDSGAPVVHSCRPPFRFTGTIDQATIDPEQEVRGRRRGRAGQHDGIVA